MSSGEFVAVEVSKEAGVLGVRIAGGSDKPYGGGFIRIKQLTADTVASRSGLLLEGDILLQVFRTFPSIGLCESYIIYGIL